MAKLLRPWQQIVRDKLKEVEITLPQDVRERVWFHLTNSYNSDGQWPPTTKASPHIIYPFNYKYNFENLLAAELLPRVPEYSSLRALAPLPQYLERPPMLALPARVELSRCRILLTLH